MPTPTYTPLANITLTGTDNEIVFGNIPNSYRDLILVFSGTDNNGAGNIEARFNSDTGSNYSRIFMLGTGSTTSSGSNTSQNNMGLMSQANGRQLNFIWNIMDYSATDKHKTSLLRDNDAGLQVVARAFRWANTSAVTSISIYTTAGQFVSGSTFALYGIVS